MSKVFLFARMAVYVLAVPVAAYLGGTFNADTGMLTIDLNHTLEIAGGFVVAAATFLGGRVAKARGGAT